MADTERDRWIALWERLGDGRGAPGKAFARLLDRYGEPHRAYHTFDHVAACLADLDQARHLAEDPDAVEAALFFHDVVYRPRRTDSEKQSALFGLEVMESLGVPAGAARRVSDLVLATRHDRERTLSGDGALVADVDLAVLGKGETAFDEYESGIRFEYSWAPWERYCEERARVMRAFLGRRRLYRTDRFHGLYEETARANLERLLGDITAWQEEVGGLEAME